MSKSPAPFSFEAELDRIAGLNPFAATDLVINNSQKWRSPALPKRGHNYLTSGIVRAMAARFLSCTYKGQYERHPIETPGNDSAYDAAVLIVSAVFIGLSERNLVLLTGLEDVFVHQAMLRLRLAGVFRNNKVALRRYADDRGPKYSGAFQFMLDAMTGAGTIIAQGSWPNVLYSLPAARC